MQKLVQQILKICSKVSNTQLPKTVTYTNQTYRPKLNETGMPCRTYKMEAPTHSWQIPYQTN